jgi:hypothetical protein
LGAVPVNVTLLISTQNLARAHPLFIPNATKSVVGTAPFQTKTYDDVAGVTALLWKGAVPTTDFVAFGINSGCALARFCVDINKVTLTGTAPNQSIDPTPTETTYKANVEKQCVDADGVDFCFSDNQLKEINK